MTDHPKPIARCTWNPDSEGMVLDGEGDYVLYADHEAALAAQAKEFNERVEALAREWEARIEVHEAQRRSALYSRYEVLDAKVTIFKGCAAELCKLLEEGK